VSSINLGLSSLVGSSSGDVVSKIKTIMEEKKESLGSEIVRSIFDKHLNAVLFTVVTVTYLIINRK
jgi:hypothetical protein